MGNALSMVLIYILLKKGGQEMGSLSRLSKTRQKCPYVDSCQNKRIEALAYYPESMVADAYENIAAPMTQPILRETMKINIDGTLVEAYKDNIFYTLLPDWQWIHPFR